MLFKISSSSLRLQLFKNKFVISDKCLVELLKLGKTY